MTLREWMKRYYPLPADETTPAQAISHSLRKWEGLAAHADHYACDIGRLEFVDGIFYVNASTCALCVHYLNPKEWDCCESCPLAIIRGGVACDDRRPDEDRDPYDAWVTHGDADQMIRWLRAAKGAADAVEEAVRKAVSSDE